MIQKLVLFLVCLLTFAHVVHAEEPSIDIHTFSSSAQSKRFQLLIKDIRCIVCNGQNIAESNAPLANDLRKKIYRMILEQKSNESIKHYLVKRYGELILLEPPFNKITAALWLFPGSVILLLFLFYLLKSNPFRKVK